MERISQLRQAVLTWLEQARDLPAIPQAITDVALAARPEWETLSNAVVLAAPISDHRDLYGKFTGDWLPRWHVLLGASGLGDATRLIAQGTAVPVDEVADSFVAFCTAPAPAAEDWLLLTGELPEGTRLPLGRYTLQTFTADELAQLGPMPALHGLQPGGLDLDLLAGAPFVHAPNPDRMPDRRGTHWFDFTGPRPEALHWRALLPLILWSDNLLHVDAVFNVERGRYFELNQNHVPTTLQTYEDRYGSPEEFEVRATGSFYLASVDLPRMQAFCSAVTAKIDAVMDGATSGRSLPRKRARRLERAARHLLQAYQRTHSDNGVWEQEADELHLDSYFVEDDRIEKPLRRRLLVHRLVVYLLGRARLEQPVAAVAREEPDVGQLCVRRFTPHLVAPTTLPFVSKMGTVESTVSPRGVVNVPVWACPPSAWSYEPNTCLPISCGLGWVQRMPAGLNTTM